MSHKRVNKTNVTDVHLSLPRLLWFGFSSKSKPQPSPENVLVSRVDLSSTPICQTSFFSLRRGNGGVFVSGPSWVDGWGLQIRQSTYQILGQISTSLMYHLINCSRCTHFRLIRAHLKSYYLIVFIKYLNYLSFLSLPFTLVSLLVCCEPALLEASVCLHPTIYLFFSTRG